MIPSMVLNTRASDGSKIVSKDQDLLGDSCVADHYSVKAPLSVVLPDS